MGSRCILIAVTVFQMKMTYDDQYLITISEDSCIMIWKVQDREGRNLKRDKEMLYAEEILITKSDLEDKVCSFILIATANSQLVFSTIIPLLTPDRPVNEVASST